MDFSRIQDFDMQLLHVFNGSENVWLDQMAMALTSGWTWIDVYKRQSFISQPCC